MLNCSKSGKTVRKIWKIKSKKTFFKECRKICSTLFLCHGYCIPSAACRLLGAAQMGFLRGIEKFWEFYSVCRLCNQSRWLSCFSNKCNGEFCFTNCRPLDFFLYSQRVTRKSEIFVFITNAHQSIDIAVSPIAILCFSGIQFPLVSKRMSAGQSLPKRLQNR